jgi:hypothetical protein
VDSGVRIDHPDLAGNVLKGWNFVPAGQVGPERGPGMPEHLPACAAYAPVLRPQSWHWGGALPDNSALSRSP